MRLVVYKRIIIFGLFILALISLGILKQKAYEQGVKESVEQNISSAILPLSPIISIYEFEHHTYESVCKNSVLNTELPGSDGAIGYVVQNIEDLLGVQDQVSAGIKCVSDKKSYAISVAPVSDKVTNNFSFCEDSRGFFGQGYILSGQCEASNQNVGYYPPVLPTYNE